MSLPTGVCLGRYEITTLIGAGGMGEVYRARDRGSGATSRSRCCPPSSRADAERLRRFEQEARAAAALNHPNIVAIYDVGTSTGAPYVVTELLEGETLASASPAARCRAQGARLAQQIARGLAAAHGKGIVHRDLKPENVFVTQDGLVKILDFGLAKLGGPATAEQSHGRTDATAQRPASCSARRLHVARAGARAKRRTTASDIFSFGAVLYEMLSGQRAFQRQFTGRDAVARS